MSQIVSNADIRIMQGERPLNAGLDVVVGDDGAPRAQKAQADETSGARPFLMVTFTCANAYVKVFRSADGSHYLARCPKCAKTMRFAVGSGGSEQRVFQVSC